MRRTTFAGLSTVSALVLLFSYHTSTSASATASSSRIVATAPGPTSSPTPAPAAGPTTMSSATSSASSSSAASTSSGTYTGAVVDTRWGAVQVRITVRSGRITAAEAVEYPQGNPRDQQINAYAVPRLNQEVVKAQSASIDAVSGATVTSDGYVRSLQSAIDEAHA